MDSFPDHPADLLAHRRDGFRPRTGAGFDPVIEPAALPCPLANRGWGESQLDGGGLNVGDELLDFAAHGRHDNVIYHSPQRESSHSQLQRQRANVLSVTESEIFRANLLRVMAEQNLTEAELSRAANLNPRAVTDIREGRVGSPKLSTVFALSRALRVDPGELLGLGKRHMLIDDLAEFLGQYGPEDQARLLAALSALPLARA